MLDQFTVSHALQYSSLLSIFVAVGGIISAIYVQIRQNKSRRMEELINKSAIVLSNSEKINRDLTERYTDIIVANATMHEKIAVKSSLKNIDANLKEIISDLKNVIDDSMDERVRKNLEKALEQTIRSEKDAQAAINKLSSDLGS